MEKSASWEADRFSADQKFDHPNNIWWTVQTVKLITNEHLPLVLPLCALPETTCTYNAHSNSPYARTVVLPGRRDWLFLHNLLIAVVSVPKSVYLLSQICTSVCRPDVNIKCINANVRQLIYFIITTNRYTFRPTGVIISTASTDHIKRIQLHCQKRGIMLFVSGFIGRYQ